jgi:hypothetical protein
VSPNEQTDVRWRGDLLSSSMPLEYLVALRFVEQGFSVSPDFGYIRADKEAEKHYSVDLLATGYPPIGDEDRVAAELHVLVECKYRRPDVSLLFFRDPNRADYSNFVIGATIRKISEYAPHEPDGVSLEPFDRSRIACFKGLDISLDRRTSNRVDDKEIKHGIEQLQYAIPYAIRRGISSEVTTLSARLDEVVPYFLCPILVTNAPLFIASENVTLEAIAGASGLGDFAEPIGSLVILSDYTPDYPDHFRTALDDLIEDGEDRLALRSLSSLRLKHRLSSKFLSPMQYIDALVDGEQWILSSLARQFVVCTYSALPALLSSLVACVNNSVLKATSLPSRVFAEAKKHPLGTKRRPAR